MTEDEFERLPGLERIYTRAHWPVSDTVRAKGRFSYHLIRLQFSILSEAVKNQTSKQEVRNFRSSKLQVFCSPDLPSAVRIEAGSVKNSGFWDICRKDTVLLFSF